MKSDKKNKKILEDYFKNNSLQSIGEKRMNIILGVVKSKPGVDFPIINPIK